LKNSAIKDGTKSASTCPVALRFSASTGGLNSRTILSSLRGPGLRKKTMCSETWSLKTARRIGALSLQLYLAVLENSAGSDGTITWIPISERKSGLSRKME
jgi:hypothetical protein